MENIQSLERRHPEALKAYKPSEGNAEIDELQYLDLNALTVILIELLVLEIFCIKK